MTDVLIRENLDTETDLKEREDNRARHREKTAIY